MPKISIIIPIYNVEKYLGECLDSVINQTFKDIEIICVDDCGSDNSTNIAEKYTQKDKRIKIIYHECNKGQAISRNDGIDIAKGEYIYFLDSDDYILPDTLEKLYENACNSQADIVIGKANCFSNEQSPEVLKRLQIHNQYFNQLQKGSYNISIDNFINTVTSLPVTPWGKLYRKEFLFNNHLKFIEQNVIHEDEGFWLKVCSCFPKIVFIDDATLMYRIHSKSTMSIRTKTITKKHMQAVLKDTFIYFDQYKTNISTKLKEQINNNKLYYIYMNYEKEFGFLYRIRWIKNNKVILILGIPIFREKENNGHKIIRIFGIPVYWSKL